MDHRFALMQSLKIAIACVLAIIIYQALHIPLGMFSVITIYVLMTVTFKESVEKGLERLLGGVLGVLIAFWMMHWFVNFPLLYFVGLCAGLWAMFYWFADECYPYAALIGGLTLAVVMSIDLTSYAASLSFSTGWVVGIALGVVIVWVMDRYWPVAIKQSFIDGFHDNLKAACALGEDPKALLAHASCVLQLRQDLSRLHKETGSQWLIKTRHLWVHYAGFLATANKYIADDSPIVVDVMQPLKQALKDVLVQLPAMVKNTQLTLHVPPAINGYRTWLLQAYADKRAGTENVPALVFELDCCLRFAAEIVGFNRHSRQSNPSSFRISWPSWDVAVFQHSTKMVFGVLLVILTNIYLHWPGLIQAVIAVIILTAQPNLGKAHLRFSLRFVGVLFGGCLGLLGVFLLSHFTHYWFLLLYCFLTLGATAYISLGDERFAYAGLQAGIMIPIILLMSTGLDNDMTVAVQRFFGVFEGACVAALVCYVLWPQHPLKQFRSKSLRAISLCATLFKSLAKGDVDVTAIPEKIERHDMALLKDASYLLVGGEEGLDNYEALMVAINHFSLLVVSLVDWITLHESEVACINSSAYHAYFMAEQARLDALIAGDMSEMPERLALPDEPPVLRLLLQRMALYVDNINDCYKRMNRQWEKQPELE